MRLTAVIAVLIGCLLGAIVVRPTWAAGCAEADKRIDFADVTFCFSKANDVYRYAVDEHLLQFAPQTFIGDERVPSDSYYDADGNAPTEGTYIAAFIRSPIVGQGDVRQYAKLKQFLNEKIEAHPGKSAFEHNGERGKVTFRRLDDSTIIASTGVAEDGVLVSEIWLHLDSLGKIEHMLRCKYFISGSAALSALPMECISWFPVGTSIATMQLSGGNQERSYRLSRQIRSDIEGFIENGSNP